MKKVLFILLLWASPLLAAPHRFGLLPEHLPPLPGSLAAIYAQTFVGVPQLTAGAGAPANTNCNNYQIYADTTAGTFYSCKNGTLTAVAGSGSVATTGNPLSTQCAFFSGALTITGSVNCLYTAASGYSLIQGSNNVDMIFGSRFTDTNPTGNFLHFQTAALTDLFTLDVTGKVTATSYATSASTGGITSLGQGTDPTGLAPANSFSFYAPTSIATGYFFKVPAAECASAGFIGYGAAAAHVNSLVCGTAHSASVPLTCAAASASGTAYTCSTVPTFTPADGDMILFEADVANTGATTLNVNASSAAGVKKQGGGTALVANDFLAGQNVLLVYDGTNWQVQGLLGNAAGSSTTTFAPVNCTANSNCTTEGAATQATTNGNQNTASVNNTTKIYFQGINIPANTITASTVFRTCGIFKITLSSPPNLTFSFNLGTGPVYTNASAAPSIVSGTVLQACIDFQGTAAAGASVAVLGGSSQGRNGITLGGADNTLTGQPIAGFATNGALVASWSSTWSTNTASNNVEQLGFWIVQQP